MFVILQMQFMSVKDNIHTAVEGLVLSSSETSATAVMCNKTNWTSVCINILYVCTAVMYIYTLAY